VKEITRTIDELRGEAERAERNAELQRVAEIRYGELPALEKELAERESEDGSEPMVKEEVDEDDVAAVVARWTGIPVDRLLDGAPPGYIGYDEGGQLTEAVRRRPYSVVLLDEIEKAHPDVFNILLQILDDGRLTDGQGRTVDFRNTVLIMTSNVRSGEAMTDIFRPEFLNRIDEIVEFEPLSKEQIGEIVELQLRRVEARLAERGLRLELTDAAKETLAEAGWDPTYGARPLKRAI